MVKNGVYTFWEEVRVEDIRGRKSRGVARDGGVETRSDCEGREVQEE